MNWQVSDLIRRVRADLQFAIKQRVASVIRFAQTTRSTTNGYGDAVQGNQTTEEEQPGGYQYVVRRLWPFGIRSRPPAGVDAVVVHAFGGATNGVMVGAESPEYGPDDLEDGEVAIYCKQGGSLVKLWASGGVSGKITIDAGNSQDVVVNAGTLEVARRTDPVSITGGTFSPTSLVLDVKDSLGATGTIALSVAAGALVVTPVGVTPGTFTMTGTITSGASRFKG